MVNKNKILKIVLLILLVIFALIGLTSTFRYCSSTEYSSNNDGIAVTNPITQTNNSDKKEFSFQYSEPQKISGSNYSMMKVIAKGESSKELYKRAGYSEPYPINILFFNLSENEFHLLFDKKVLLTDSYSSTNQSDSTIDKIFYTVVTEDTDADEFLTDDDNHILFTSNKIGKNLFQITESKVNVDNFIFLDKNNLLITVSTPKKETPREKWVRNYIQFNLTENKIIPNNKFASSLLEAINVFKK